MAISQIVRNDPCEFSSLTDIREFKKQNSAIIAIQIGPENENGESFKKQMIPVHSIPC